MDTELITRLFEITAEERSVLSDNYNLTSDAEPAFANMTLKRKDYIWNVLGTRHMVTVKPHTRFVDIPIHSHGYLEMMYVCEGAVTHFIDGRTLILEAGELLMMNRHTKHSVAASGRRDIAVNLVVSNDFLRVCSAKFRNSLPLSELAEHHVSESGRSRYLIYRIGNNPSAENLLENLIRSALFQRDVPQIILTETLSLIFRYLEMYPDALIRSADDATREESKKTIITDYIETGYRTASLTELAERLGMTPQYVSCMIRRLFGAGFIELITEKRMFEAERLLTESDLSVQEIAEAIGYENNSFFHKRFREQYGTTPAKWKKSIRSDK